MLIPEGKVLYENLSTAFTDIDHLIDELEQEKKSGYCEMNFPGYEGVVLFNTQSIQNGLEHLHEDSFLIRTGQDAVSSFLAKAREKGRKISVYQLPEEMVRVLSAALNGTPVHKNLSTELTSLDVLFTTLKDEGLSGYIEVIFADRFGIANLFVANGELTESIMATAPPRILAPHTPVDTIRAMCEEHKAVFNVYQARETSVLVRQVSNLEGPVPQKVVTLFEQMLVCLGYATDPIAKPGTFENVLKHLLPQLAEQYQFLDPFLGEFHYAQNTLRYEGDAAYKTFVDGLCTLVTACLSALYEIVPKTLLLVRIAQRIESVSLAFDELIDRLKLKTCLPEMFLDYAVLKEAGLTEAAKLEKYVILNLRSTPRAELSAQDILERWYRSLARIHEQFCVPESGLIRYVQLQNSSEFRGYKNATALLHRLDLTALQGRDAQLAFWNNVYNFLTIDGILEYGLPASIREIKDFFVKTSYLIGKHVFSLDDIEHGILRNNRRHPTNLSRQFNTADPRNAFCIDPFDPRIHCCLNCGTISSPPLTVFHPENLDDRMKQAVYRFLTAHGMRFDREKHELWLDHIFSWYRKDFEHDGVKLLDFVIAALQDTELAQALEAHRKHVKIHFLDYDWNLNNGSSG